MVIKIAHENVYMRENLCRNRKCIVPREGIIKEIKFRECEKEDRFFDPDVKGEGTRKGNFIEKSLGMVGR
jgi:hypothetical protein